MREVKKGNIYTLNEDMKGFFTFKEGVSTEPIKAGAKCTVIKQDDDWVTLEFENGRTVRTEDHMISEYEDDFIINITKEVPWSFEKTKSIVLYLCGRFDLNYVKNFYEKYSFLGLELLSERFGLTTYI